MSTARALDVAVIYDGQATLPATMQLGEWGAAKGTLPTATKPVAVKNAGAGVPIATRGRYQGTRIDLTPPIDTDMFLGAPDAYLELYLRATPTAATTKASQLPALRNLRITLYTESGVGVLSIPAADFFPQQEIAGGWVVLDLPLSRLSTKDALSGAMSRLVISSDDAATMLLGRLAFVRDVSPLQAAITTFPATLQTGQPVVFTAHADGAVTDCRVSWDFDTAAGPTVDATGDRVSYVYANAGTYTVTCTVRDVNGVKDPITLTREVKITRGQ